MNPSFWSWRRALESITKYDGSLMFKYPLAYSCHHRLHLKHLRKLNRGAIFVSLGNAMGTDFQVEGFPEKEGEKQKDYLVWNRKHDAFGQRINSSSLNYRRTHPTNFKGIATFMNIFAVMEYCTYLKAPLLFFTLSVEDIKSNMTCLVNYPSRCLDNLATDSFTTKINRMRRQFRTFARTYRDETVSFAHMLESYVCLSIEKRMSWSHTLYISLVLMEQRMEWRKEKYQKRSLSSK